MTDFEKTLLHELSTLPESRQADVLAFVRYLKMGIPGEELEIEKRVEKALKSIRNRAKKLNIPQESIDAEISAARADPARGA